MAIDPLIKKETDVIRNEQWADKVRSSIANGLDYMSEDVVEIDNRQKSLESDFVAVQQDARSNTPSGAELAVAAGPYNTLGERLDAEEQKVNAQLAQTAQKLERTINLNVDGIDLQKAFNDMANNNCVFDLNGGFYEIDHPLILRYKSNVRLTGKGIIKLKNQADNQKILVVIDSSDVELDNFTIDGNRSNQTIYGVSERESWNVSENCPAILIENVKNADIHNIYGHHVLGDFIQVDIILDGQQDTLNRESKNINIFKNEGEFIGRNGISLVHCDGVEIYNNKISHVDLYTTTLATGIDIEPNGGVNNFAKNIRIYNNDIEYCASAGIHLFHLNDLSEISNVEIYNNHIVKSLVGHLTLNCKTQGQNIVFQSNKISECNTGFAYDDSIDVLYKDEVINDCVKTEISNGFGIASNINFTNSISKKITLSGIIINGTDDVGVYLKNIQDSEIDVYVKEDSRKIDRDKASIRILDNSRNIKIITSITKSEGSFPIYLTDDNNQMGLIEIYNNSFFNGKDIGVAAESSTVIRNNNNYDNGIFDGVNTTPYHITNDGVIVRGVFKGQGLAIPSKDVGLGQGEIAFDSIYGSLNVQDGFGIKKVQLFRYGLLADRPTGLVRNGEQYFAVDYKVNGGWLTYVNGVWIDDRSNPSIIVP